MSNDLSIRLYFSEPPSVERFEALAQAVQASPLASHEWKDLQVAVRRPLQYRVEHEGKLTPEELREAARDAGLGADEHMACHTSLRCWRRDGTRMVDGWVFAFVEAWGENYARLNEEDVRMGGTAGITLSHSGPFVADLSGANVVYNEKVEENLERLTQLMVHLTNTLQPDALKVFDDDGLRLPFNAHVGFFRSAETVLEDLALMRQVWDVGLPLHRVDPLRSYGGGSQDGALHLWRTPEQRTELSKRLSAVIGKRPTVDDVKAVLDTGRFDTLIKGDSFFVLEYPHFMNAFVDRFYLEILERAAA